MFKTFLFGNFDIQIVYKLQVTVHRQNCETITGLDIGYVPAGPHAFLRLSGQSGPPQFIFHWP